MLTEDLASLAMAGGTAVVHAASTEAWEGCRAKIERLMRHGRNRDCGEALERLDERRAQEPEERTLEIERAFWVHRFTVLLSTLHGSELVEAITVMRELTGMLEGSDQDEPQVEADIVITNGAELKTTGDGSPIIVARQVTYHPPAETGPGKS